MKLPPVTGATLTGSGRTVTVAAEGLSWRISYPRQLIVGGETTVGLHIVTKRPVDLHIALRGCYQKPPNYWGGHLSYREQTLHLALGTHTLQCPFAIPPQLYAEREAGPKFQAQNYYFHIFACPPARGLTPDVPQQSGGANGPWSNYKPSDSTQVIYPELGRHRLATAGISMIKTRAIPSGSGAQAIENLLARLEDAATLIDEAYDTHSFHQLNVAVRAMEGFITELRSNNKAGYWPSGQECIDLANLTILWMIEAMTH